MSFIYLILFFLFSFNAFSKEKRDELNRIIYVDTHDDYVHANMTVPMRNSTSRYKFDYFKVVPNEKKIALTFDCAELNEKNATDILDSLKKYNIKATFFIAGAFIFKDEFSGFSESNLHETNFKLIKRMIDEGHDIGNHSTTHPHNDPTINWGKELTTLEKGWFTILGKIYGNTIIPKNGIMKNMWRAPYGEYNDQSLTKAAMAGYTFHFGWNVDTQDSWGRPSCETYSGPKECWSAAKMTNQVLKYFSLNSYELPNVVVLAHLSNAYLWGKSSNGFDKFVQVVTDHNYSFDKISNLFKYPILEIKKN